MIKLAAQVVPLKTNAEKEGKELAQKYGVRGYPTILFLDTGGEVMGKIGGYLPPERFAAEMTKVQDSIKDFEKTQETLKKSPEDGEANAKLANLMAMRGKQKEAEAAIGKAEKAKYGGEPLAEAYNGVGDLYQSAGEFDKAIEYFRKADAASKEMSTRGYALASIMTCHQQAGQTDKAKAVAKKLVEMKDMPKEYVDGAKALLEQQP